MFRWVKLGRVFDPTAVADRSWMKQYAQAPSVLIFPASLRVYFSCRPAADEHGRYLSYLAYVDLDRSDLFRLRELSPGPVMKLGARGTFDEFGVYPASVIRDGQDIRVYYAGWTRCESVPFNAAIGMAVSRDGGDTFERIGDGPVLSYCPDEPFVLGSPKIRKFNDRWYLWYASGRKWVETNGAMEPVYTIRMARSEDSITWSRCGRDLIETRLTDYECQASPDVFASGGRYHMFFSYRRHALRNYVMGYAWSPDVVNWVRDDARVGIGLSETGWDSQSISYGHVFSLDGSTYMLYQGNEIGKYGFGLARLDGTL
jgi:sucrose-6-phosphate hydrolase SacC (GH32 family)